MKLNPKYILFVFIFLGSGLAFAQPEEELPSEEVNIEKQFDAVLREANKKLTSPKIPPIDTTRSKAQRYDLPPKLLTLQYDAPMIRPLAMRKQAPDPIYGLYAKAGFGLPLSPYAEILYSTGKTDQFNFRVGGKHHSMNSDNNVENQRFAHNSLGLGATYFLESGYAIDGDLGLKIDQIHFYGYDDSDTSKTKESVQQRFTTFQGKADFFNHVPTVGDINYTAGIDLYTHNDNFDSNEFGVGGSATFSKWFDDKYLIQLKAADHIFNFNDTITQTNNLFEVEPSVITNFGLVRLKIGLYLGVSNDVSVFPDIEILGNLMDGKVQLFAGWNGKQVQNSFKSITDYNPYMASRMTLMNTLLQNRYAGVKGQLYGFSYEIRGAHRPAKNMLMYVNDYAVDSTRFTPVYDKVSSVNLHVSGSVTILKDLELFISSDYNVFSTDSLAEAWHLPNLEANIGAEYTYQKKLTLLGELYLANGAKYLTSTGGSAQLNTLFDLNFGARYQFLENFSVFLDVNNVLGSNFRRWHGYPQVGANFLAGIIIKL